VDASGTFERLFHPDRRRGLFAVVAVAGVIAIVAVVLLIPHDDAGGTSSAPRPTGSGAVTTEPRPSPGAFAQGAGAPGPLTVLAHRGGSEKYPHETLLALVSAAEAGEAVETDVRWTSDNVPILVHEDTTGPAGKANTDLPLACTGGPYVIARTTWNELSSHCRTIASAATDGTRYPIATLDQTVKAIAAVPGAWIFAEVKAENQTLAQTALFLAIIEKYGMARRAVVTSFYPDALQRVRTQAQADGVPVNLMLFLGPVKGKLPPVAELAAQHLYAVAVRSDGISASYVRALKAHKLVVIDWTVNSRAQWAAAKAAGVTAVLTDLPGAYRASLT
jgi:glycerophosphoryl diester phosphodiesterase